ncbi:MAG TPA: DUF4058 family protein [Gemmata sp.]|nr:DUF4058 family protein [Gemmata sp.]
MPSPFPGMNPFIEQPAVWQDFHTRFMVLAAELIGVQVEPRYFVKIEEHLFLHEWSADERRPFGRPDLTLVPGDRLPGKGVSKGVTITAPATVFVPAGVDEFPQRYLEIRDRQTRQVVTVLELLSPSNKDPSGDREQYWKKTRLLVNRTAVGLVEIDLLRGGPRLPWVDMPVCDYYALVSSPATRPKVDFWPIQLRGSLPSIPIPLRPGDVEPTLDLQAMIHQIHDVGRYRMFIYDSDPEPPLPAADAVWAVQILEPPPTV